MHNFILTFGCLWTAVQGIFLVNEIMRLYARQGLPFREDKFLNNEPILEEYDFIIAGSGPTGSVIANRLTEVPGWDVLLLEAGMEENIYTTIPLINFALVLTNYSWGYKTERQEGICSGFEDKVCLWPSGRGVGGGTVMNAMMYTRGHPTDFDRWAENGNPGWSYEEVLPYFLKSERMTLQELKHSPYHSPSGIVNIENPFPSPLVKRFLKAGLQFGYDEVDYNDARTPIGFSRTQTTMRRGRRHSAAAAYLLPIKHRHNLHIAKNAFVTKILIDPKQKVAYGFEFIKNGRVRRVFARREIILSAGAFNTPKLLLLSGIGPRDHLNELNIPLIENLPVGDGLQEHISTAMTFLINTTDSFHLMKTIQQTIPNFARWLKFGEGPLANNAAEAVAYIKTNISSTKPDIELIFVPLTVASDKGYVVRKTSGVTDETFYPLYGKITNREGFTIFPMMMYPESKGKVRLTTSDPYDPPRIIPNFLTNRRDVEVLIEGIKNAVALGDTNAFKEIGTQLHKTPIPGCELLVFGSDDYWECMIRHIVVQFHHQCCTSRMGPNPDSSVVDSYLRVHGIKRLRVADASIMPSITGAHTMAPCYMIGEKAADLIKSEWRIHY